VVWAIDFRFDSSIDGRTIKITSMIDEHTRMSPLNLVERSISLDRLVAELDSVFATAGRTADSTADGQLAELVSQALQRFCGD
jgi:putative transposase